MVERSGAFMRPSYVLTTIAILPGLDGTSLLLREFAALANAIVVEYPRDRVMSYDELAAHAIAQLLERPILIGESFGGAIATLVASRIDAAALVLVNSFIVPPLPRVFGRFPFFIPPEWLLAYFLGGKRGHRAAIQSVRRDVLASRIRMVLNVDVRAALASTTMPLVDLRARGDRLVNHRSRRAVIAARPDAKLLEVDGPHALLFGNASAAWEAIARAVC
jgi:pimeloyl-ACP methyl ester carboxylesterase